MLTPIEIQNKIFKSSGLGYDKKDVDNFVTEVLQSYEALYREKMELGDKINVLTEGLQYYKTIEKTLQKALVLAEKTAEETKAGAQKNAKAIEKEAVAKSQMILADARAELEQIRRQVMQLAQQYDTYKTQVKTLAIAQIELMESPSFQLDLSVLTAMDSLPDRVESTASAAMDSSYEMPQWHNPLQEEELDFIDLNE